MNGLARRRVLVTRPFPDAVATSAKLKTLGYDPVLLPVNETVPTHIALPIGVFDAIAVTSANALRHANTQQLAQYRHSQLYAVGDKTASVAREAGFEKTYSGDGWGQNLGAYVAGQQPAGSLVLYLTGKIRRPDFEAQLGGAGINVVVAETYDTRLVSYSEAQLADILGAGPAEVILLYSAAAAQQFMVLDKQVNGAFLKNAKYIFCLSHRIAAELPDICKAEVRISPTPDEDALLRLLALS